MADEVRNQNVIRVYRDGRLWRAVIGPCLSRGVSATADGPIMAVFRLACALIRERWLFDDSYHPRTPPTFHEA